MKYLMIIMAVFCFIVTAGCATGNVVSTSGARPKWAFDRPMYSANGNVYASGMFTDAPNLGKGLDVAAKLAEIKLVESMRLWLIDRFNYVSTGIDISDTALNRVVSSTTDINLVNGLAHSKYYYEKRVSGSALGPAYRYDCFALVEISFGNYMKAVKSVANKALSPALADELMGRIEKEGETTFGGGGPEIEEKELEE